MFPGGGYHPDQDRAEYKNDHYFDNDRLSKDCLSPRLDRDKKSGKHPQSCTYIFRSQRMPGKGTIGRVPCNQPVANGPGEEPRQDTFKENPYTDKSSSPCLMEYEKSKNK